MQPKTTTDHSEANTLYIDSSVFHRLSSSVSSCIHAQTSQSIKRRRIHRPMHKLDTLSDAVRGFTPAWFTATMGTGITAVLLYAFPYSCAPLRYIGMAIALLNLVLYVLFSALFAWRLVRYRDFYSILLHPQMSMALGAIPMGLCTIIIAVVDMITPYGAPWVPTLALVLWCVVIALSVLSFLAIPSIVISHQKHTLDSISAILLLPVVPTVVAASTGAVVCSVHSGNPATAILMISYMLWAMGLGLSMMLLAIYLVRLILFKLPPKEAIASVFIPLGPLGQSSYGIQILGAQSLRIFPSTLPHIAYLGNVLYDVGFFFGMLIWSLAIWWFLHAVYSIIYTRVHGKVPFNLGWWALIFPIGTFASSSNSLWTITGYMFFRVLTAILNSGIFALWLLIVGNSIRYAWTGELLKPAAISQLELDDKTEDGISEEQLYDDSNRANVDNGGNTNKQQQTHQQV
ncbi:Plasma membrane sulfite pump involved in sulfite metabolism [Coemansia spiralis]|uniref:Plasma membrane sulfite pump involved in sulfite metabolism n=2 Tax=Coemansia TaxID=4863 RepID=A0A9W8GAC5_9FUNG|nr:Plasma membrane sulfite pump involved in sulfite metabolism [Coemansia umbellata]KAJ2624548.1 Plasma membrane sulfite pump involved in sulfite metabolism [Coemansia sp. RSA 1358]KAJ2679484.1 Plasma membrane sulfite pump involved in sulfite metabolism [Coemansia spiralis]